MFKNYKSAATQYVAKISLSIYKVAVCKIPDPHQKLSQKRNFQTAIEPT